MKSSVKSPTKAISSARGLGSDAARAYIRNRLRQTRYRMRYCAAALGLLLARPAPAQTRFAWPSDTGDVARFTTVEECLAATSRVRNRVEKWAPVWSDTLALTPQQAAVPLPLSVIATARRCSARFAAQTAPVADFTPLMSLYLFAGRDADAETILHRRLAAITPTAQHERVAVLDSALQSHLDLAMGSGFQQPIRLASAESLLVEVGRLPDSLHSVAARLTPAFQFLRASKTSGDTARTRRAAQHYLDLNARLTSADRRDNFYTQYGALAAYLALTTLQEASLLDSLRGGTAGYVALQRAAWAKSSGESPLALHFPIGERAPTITADFWLGTGDASATRPTKGKVSLVVFLDYDCRFTSNGACWPGVASLHRLAQRFPALEVTVAARTHGWFSAMAPPPPAQEAETLREWWRDFHRLPGALGVTVTDFWRLDPPDRRRIDRATPNETHYTFGRTWQIDLPNAAFLVDRDGIIVEVGQLGVHSSLATPDVEEHLARLIEILLARTP
jgi:hypothetical protein